MHVIALISQKGGSGKTTLATALAVAHQQDGGRAAIADLDPQGSSVAWHHFRDGEPPLVAAVHPPELPNTQRFAERPMPPGTIRAMLKRRLRDAGLPSIITPHSFRAMVVTDLLTQGVPIEDVQYLVGHAHPSTTQIYDRRARTVSRNTVERISI